MRTAQAEVIAPACSLQARVMPSEWVKSSTRDIRSSARLSHGVKQASSGIQEKGKPGEKQAVPAVGGERLGELAGEDGVDHFVLLLPDGRVYPAARARLCPHGHQAAPGPRRLRGGWGDDGEAARGGGGAERGRHGPAARFSVDCARIGLVAVAVGGLGS